MAMLAEPRRRQKMSADPRGLLWSNDDQKFGQKLMEKMGWQKGRGLGANEDGRVEHVKVSVKNNDRGVGCKKTNVDDWIAHQDDFNSLLSQLNQSNDTEVETTLQSLEKTSKETKGRLHYQKFTRGKDLSSAKQNDLNSIFGRRNAASTPKLQSTLPQVQSEANLEEKPNSAVETGARTEHSHGITTVSTGTSVNDYFSRKMAELKARVAGNAKQVQKPDELETVNSGAGIGSCGVDTAEQGRDTGVLQQIDGHLDAAETDADGKNKNKKKKKSKIVKTDESLSLESAVIKQDLDANPSENVNNASSHRKKGKKGKSCNLLDKDDNADMSVVGCVEMDSNHEIVRKSKSKKKKKSKHNNADVIPEMIVTVEQESSRKTKKKTGKKQQENCEELNFDPIEGKSVQNTRKRRLEVGDDESSPKKSKKKSKKAKLENCCSDIDEDVSNNQKTEKSKKKKTKSQDQTDEVKSESDHDLPKKKKKKKLSEVDKEKELDLNKSKKVKKTNKRKRKRASCEVSRSFVGTNLAKIVGYGNGKELGYSQKHAPVSTTTHVKRS